MPNNFIPSAAEYIRILPEIILSIVATFIMVMEAMRDESRRAAEAGARGFFARIDCRSRGTFAANAQPGAAFQQMMIVDGFATFFRALGDHASGSSAVLCSGQYLRRERSEGGEYYALILFSVAGQCIMATSNELIMMFIGLEISSIATYILAGYLRDDKRNNESALKYFLLGSFATAFLLYGVAWIYGITGSTNLVEIRRVLSAGQGTSMSLVGVVGGADVCRLRFQDFGRAVSGVGSGRLRGRSGAGCGVHVLRSQSGRVRDLHSRLHDCVRADRQPMGGDRVGLRAVDDDRR